ncbi:MAG: PAS domain S-box protein [Candidatus Dadabacteria bacterium]|nr:MAG: PAS domain S-box protein [Candidatus Dadabacteria bacterium]
MKLQLRDLWQPVAAVVEPEAPVAGLPPVGRDAAVVVRGHGGVLAVASGPAIARALDAGRGRDPVLGIAEPARAVPDGQALPLLEPGAADHAVVGMSRGAAVGWVPRERLLEAGFKALCARMDKLRVALDAAYNAIVVVDAEGRVVAANKALGRVLGVEREDLIGRPIQEVVPHTGLPEVLRTREPRIGRRIELRGHVYVSNRTPIFRNGRLAGAVAVLQDVTDLESARAERDEANRWKRTLEAVLDTAYEGVVVVDERGVITMFNRAYGEFLGVDPADMVGRPVTEAIENTRMHIVLRTGEAEIRQVQRIKGHDMVCDRIPIREGDRIVGAVGKVLFRDVSELDALFEETRRLRTELSYYREELRRQNGTRYSLENLVGESPVIRELKDMVRRVARTHSTVLIQGESGTGKELVAHALHNLSPRADKPFVKVNCAAIPENLLEAELFGYREGAFTGARKGGQVGRFELARGGTVFLDEVAELPLPTQAKLLRVIQEREIEPLGGGGPVEVDLRIIAATNRDLRQLAAEGAFRQDLLYRLNVVLLEAPPLRDRKEDIPLLAERLLCRLSKTLGLRPRRLSAEALATLLAYAWPGNVRELENVLERALNLCDGDEILPAHLPHHVRRPAGTGPALAPLRQVLAEVEAEHLRAALRVANGRAVEAARLLGIGKSAFYEKAAKHGLLNS